MKKWLSIFLYTFIFISLHATCFADNCPKLTGEVLDKNSAEYDHSRLNSNYYTSKNKYPQTIVYAKTVADIQNAIRYANCKKLPVRARSGGHNHLGYSTGTGVVLIDVSRMKQIKVNEQTQI